VLFERERCDGRRVCPRAQQHCMAFVGGKTPRDPIRERENLMCAGINFPEVAARPATRLAVHAHLMFCEELRLKFMQPGVCVQRDGVDVVRRLRAFQFLRSRVSK